MVFPRGMATEKCWRLPDREVVAPGRLGLIATSDLQGAEKDHGAWRPRQSWRPQLDKAPGPSIESAALYPGRARSQGATCDPQTVDRGGPRRRSARRDLECPNRDLAGGPSAAHEPPPSAPPRAGRCRDHLQGLASAVGLALLEISLDAGHLVRHVSEAHHWPPTGARKSVERGRLHLHRQDTARAAGLDGRSGLAKRSVSCPCGPALQRNPDARGPADISRISRASASL